MVKKVIYLFLAVLFVSKLFGQNLDSLNLALKNAKHDTIRCAILLELGETAPDGEWLKYIDQLKNLTESKLKTTKPSLSEFAIYKKYYSLALYNTGFFYQSQGNSNEALSYYEKCLNIQEEIHDKQSMANTFNNIGGIYQNLGNNIKALSYYEKCLKIQEETDYKFGISAVVNNIAIIYQVQGDIPKALEYYTRSLEIQQQIGNKEGVATSFRNIASIYQKKRRYEQSLRIL
jgi:tetratricopeptide (TPR) repeat protein